MKQANIVLIAGVSQGFSTVTNIHLTSLSCSIFLKTCQHFSSQGRWGKGTDQCFFPPPNPLHLMFSHQQQQHKDSQTFFLVKANITSTPGFNEHGSEVQQPQWFSSSYDNTLCPTMLYPLGLIPCASEVGHR